MVNYDIKNIYQWPIQAKALVCATAFLLIFILLYIILTVPEKAEIAKSIKHEKDLKDQLKMMLDRQVTVKANIAQLPAIKSILAQWQEKIYTKNELPNALNEIMKLGQANNLKITSFNPADEIKDGIYYKTPVNMDITGTYDHISRFISQIANMPKLVNIDAFLITRTKELNAGKDSGPLNSNDVLTAKLDIEIYTK